MPSIMGLPTIDIRFPKCAHTEIVILDLQKVGGWFDTRVDVL